MQTSHKDAPTMRFTSAAEHMAKLAKHLYWCLWAIKLLIEPQTKITCIVHLHCCTQNICGDDSCDNIISWSGVFVTFCSLHLAQMWTAVVGIQEKHQYSCGAANETQGQNTEGQRKSSVINTRPQFELKNFPLSNFLSNTCDGLWSGSRFRTKDQQKSLFKWKKKAKRICFYCLHWNVNS